MIKYKVSEIQRMCPQCADKKVKQLIYDRNWKSASNAINTQVDQMRQDITALCYYQKFLNHLKE